MSGDDTSVSPDIMVRKRDHKIFFGPESHRGEEWLLANASPRPAPVDNLQTGERIGLRSFPVEKEALQELWDKAVSAGLIIRRQPR